MAPMAGDQFILPEGFHLYAPLALMGAFLLIQVEAMLNFKKASQLALAAKENASLSEQSKTLELQLSELKASQEQSQKDYKELKEKLASEERKAKDLSLKLKEEQRQQAVVEEQVKSSQAENNELQKAVEHSLSQTKALEKKLQEASKAASGEKDVLHLMAQLQEKGRFLDFIMDDVSAYQDVQVGAAARVVHQGCTQVLGDYFKICPIRKESEGSSIEINDGDEMGQFRLLGQVKEAPFKGTIVHKGWATSKVNLPESVGSTKQLAQGLQVIAPAEVDLN